MKAQKVTGQWSFSLETAQKLVLTKPEQIYLFLAFALAFCIKVPLFPLHLVATGARRGTNRQVR